VTPRSAGEWLALGPTAVALLALVGLTIHYMFTGQANAIVFGTFGSLLGAGLGVQGLAAAKTPPPGPGDDER
jgi:hypothetical protein